MQYGLKGSAINDFAKAEGGYVQPLVELVALDNLCLVDDCGTFGSWSETSSSSLLSILAA